MNVPGNSYGIVTNGTNTGNTITLKDSTLNVPDGYGFTSRPPGVWRLRIL